MSRLCSIRSAAVGFALSIAMAVPALAQTATFNGSVNGIRAGTLQYNARENAGQYATSFVLQSGGLAGLFGSYRMSAEATGQASGNSYRPSVYREATSEGDDRDSKELRWSGTTPRVVSSTHTQRPYHISASSASGHVDPATALHILFQNRSADEICSFDFGMFDGAHRVRISGNGRSGGGDTVQCNGTYSRVAGYSSEDMAKGRNFPFTLTYRAIGNGTYQLQTFDVRAVRGRLTFNRR